MQYPTVEYERGAVLLLDQTKIPREVVQLRCTDLATLIDAIKRLVVRGAPAIGVAAAHGATLAADLALEKGRNGAQVREELRSALRALSAARPTAVNLHWAVARMLSLLDSIDANASAQELRDAVAAEASAIHEEDVRLCAEMGAHGARLFPDPCTVLTHCNTGALATVGIGTALGVVYSAAGQGKKVQVYVDETRPLLQGARLNMWELAEHEIPATLICDGAAAWTMRQKHVDLVIVGADRIAANGDVANKIGTYSLAVNAQRHGIPFYVAAPYSTLDLSLASGAEIPIEERAAAELTSLAGVEIAPRGSAAFNPAFDVTPAALIAGIITERGVFEAPYEQSFRQNYA
jgi:methylthioribose-1-phosphate isomerase